MIGRSRLEREADLPTGMQPNAGTMNNSAKSALRCQSTSHEGGKSCTPLSTLSAHTPDFFGISARTGRQRLSKRAANSSFRRT
jgi:hypothetical protein